MIDIIIPVYNSLVLLGNAIRSISNQTFKDKVDIYIIDVCSDYGYKEIIERNKDLKIHYYRLDKNSVPGIANIIF